MSLGKRARSMRRTTSISRMAMAFDLDIGNLVPPHPSSYSSSTSHFLRACCLCKRSLVPCRDIYMYRGDMAFCSQECRQLQMNLDERKDKSSLASRKRSSSLALAAVLAGGSSEGETVAAV